MKKYPFILISALLLAITGCANDNSTVSTETTVVTEQSETDQSVMEINMDNINDVFSLDYPPENYENYNPLFLYCYYDKPSEMDLRTILYYGMGEDYNYNVNELSEEELHDLGISVDGEQIVGLVKIPKDKLNDYLVKKTGLTIDEFENNDIELEYYEQYDAYYGYRASDNIVMPIQFTSVEMNDDVYTAGYTVDGNPSICQVKFKVNDGVLQFISNHKIEVVE